MRPFVTLFAIFALLLVVGPGYSAHAGSQGLDGGRPMVSAQMDSAGCGARAAEHHPEKPQDADHRMSCCVGSVCVIGGLPVATTPLVPPAGATIDPLVTATSLIGRDVAPPLDPPRQIS